LNQPNHYELLGIEKTASQEDIKKAYRESAKKYHPDANDVSNASLIFRMMQGAYEVLSDVDRRREYDRTLVVASAPTSDSTPPQYTSSDDDEYVFFEEERIVYSTGRFRTWLSKHRFIRGIVKFVLFPIVITIAIFNLVVAFLMWHWIIRVPLFIISGFAMLASIMSIGGFFGAPWALDGQPGQMLYLIGGIFMFVISYLASPFGLTRFIEFISGKLSDLKSIIQSI